MHISQPNRQILPLSLGGGERSVPRFGRLYSQRHADSEHNSEDEVLAPGLKLVPLFNNAFPTT
jgi:hypothetical protein